MSFKVISHRGNVKGPNREKENKPNNILEVIKLGYDVEIDVWYINNEWFLGHDTPDYFINLSFLQNNKLWCHAKNINALYEMNKNNIRCFWHQDDDVTLTSDGFMWTYPGKKLTKNSICVMPEAGNNSLAEIKKAAGVCSDYPERFAF